jgi:uncharacterized protein (TIGR01777 family)
MHPHASTVIAGGSGLLGTALARRLVELGHAVVVLSRDGSGASPAPGARLVTWNPDGTVGPWIREIENARAIVNLTGAGIAERRWSPARKEVLRSSRVLSTRSLVAGVREAASRPAVFVQASGAGYYGASLDSRELDESYPPGDDYLGQLCVQWEAEALAVTTLGCRLVMIRTGIVLTLEGGALARMVTPFRCFVGGPIASGRQYMSWIHIDDWVSLVAWAVGHEAASGPINATSPTPVSNAVFSRAFGRALHRPSWMPVPGFALRLLYGEMADALLIKGQRVVPRRARELGFTFAHTDLAGALKDVVSRRG